MKSPLTVSIADQVKDAKEILAYREHFLPIKARNGEMSEWVARKSIETARRTLKLLKALERDPQTDLFALNDEMNKR